VAAGGEDTFPSPVNCIPGFSAPPRPTNGSSFHVAQQSAPIKGLGGRKVEPARSHPSALKRRAGIFVLFEQQHGSSRKTELARQEESNRTSARNDDVVDHGSILNCRVYEARVRDVPLAVLTWARACSETKPWRPLSLLPRLSEYAMISSNEGHT
jgi:hypothetical protein